MIGGLDLCLGRWDDKTHPVVDDNHISRRYPGKDYINPEAPNPLCVVCVCVCVCRCRVNGLTGARTGGGVGDVRGPVPGRA